MATIIERDVHGSGAAEGMSLISMMLALIAIAVVGALALYAFRFGAPVPTGSNPGGSVNVDVNGGTPQNTNPY
jgi:acyl dehydratase